MRIALLALFLLSCTASQQAVVPPRAVELRDLALAELENERPEQAEAACRQLIEVLPEDPLGHANLAIALLRQQKTDDATAAVEAALAKAPGRGDLLAIQAEILQWAGDLDGALELMRQAVTAAPQDLEILYAAYQLATTRPEVGGEVAADVLGRLAELRPENVVVLLQLAKQGIAAGDRTAATGAVLRVGELMWQVDLRAGRALEMVTAALEGDDVAAARVPVQRLENVLKISPMFRESLRELKTGIQGVPVRRFRDEPPPVSFGDPLTIELAATEIDPRPTAGRALAAGDFDGDLAPDLARVRAGGEPALEIRLAAGGLAIAGEHPAPGLEELLAADLDNDGDLDLVAAGPGRAAVWLGQGDGSFAPAEADLGLSTAGAAALAVIDFDIEGDLDLALAGTGGTDLYRSSLQGPLERVGDRALPALELTAGRGVAASDLDRDGDLDLVIAHGDGVAWLDNLRQGRFVDRTAEAGLVAGGPLAAVVSADLDGDGFPDLVTAGEGLSAWHNRGGRFESWSLSGLPSSGTFSSLVANDFDNDGRLDLAAAGPAGVVALTRSPEDPAVFAAVPIAGAPAAGAAAVVSADLDGDGDLDLVAAGEQGLHRLDNRGGNENHWLAVRLRGLDKGNSKNNFYGVGALVEVKTGLAYQFHEAAGDVLHLGIGRQQTADIVRVVWTNGVPQNRLQVAGDQRLVEEQLLKGSCPFLYAWNGSEMAFVTDLLWGAPLGLPVAPGAWASSDPSELVRVDGLADDDGVYRLRITEELWEAAWLDHARLWVVDHPADVEVASSLRIVPGAATEDRVLGSRDLSPVAAAWDGAGREVTAEVAERDEVYADGYRPSAYQGAAAEPWSFTFDLGAAPAAPVRLHLDGWIFPTDASINLAIAQRSDLPNLLPVIEVETGLGWRQLLARPGFPAGKTKTMILDLPALPAGASKLRIRTSLWLHWDRIAWTTRPADGEAVVRARLLPRLAELRYRGFSAMERRAPNAPHVFDYARTRRDSPWLPFPGRYTRYGDVAPLLAAADDFSAILAPGDEIALEFDGRELPPVAPGHRRTLFLESHGWDKDADRNTFEARQLEPLPFRAMSGYPYGPGETYPDTAEHRTYLEEWLTREVR